MIAGTSSNAGKTTVTLGLLEVFKRMSIDVAAFKAGPDFIDPGLHKEILGTFSSNLDSWMLERETLRSLYYRSSFGHDLAVVEGVMGLYDGASGSDDSGSSAQIARWLGLNILLVVNGRSMARSVAALVKGFLEFDRRLNFCGVIVNQVGSENHKELLIDALSSLDIDWIGFLPRNEKIGIPSRHLGLTVAEEGIVSQRLKDELYSWIVDNLDISSLLKRVLPSPPNKVSKISNDSEVFFDAVGIKRSERCVSKIHKSRPVIAVSRDAAFCFCYRENIELLEYFGAEISLFSPLYDTRLPRGTKGIYLCGGYPEIYSRRLAENTNMIKALRSAIVGGMPVYAECGGMLYLTRGLRMKGSESCWLGILPFWTKMLERLRFLGYREIEFMDDCFMASRGMRARGHEFHYSVIEGTCSNGEDGSSRNIYKSYNRKGKAVSTEGFLVYRCLASYIHLHFLSNPMLAENFVISCI